MEHFACPGFQHLLAPPVLFTSTMAWWSLRRDTKNLQCRWRREACGCPNVSLDSACTLRTLQIHGCHICLAWVPAVRLMERVQYHSHFKVWTSMMYPFEDWSWKRWWITWSLCPFDKKAVNWRESVLIWCPSFKMAYIFPSWAWISQWYTWSAGALLWRWNTSYRTPLASFEDRDVKELISWYFGRGSGWWSAWVDSETCIVAGGPRTGPPRQVEYQQYAVRLSHFILIENYTLDINEHIGSVDLNWNH